MAKYGISESTNISGKCYDFINKTTDVENGSLVAKGALADALDGTAGAKEKCIYNATVPVIGDEVYFVDNPDWDYDTSRTTNQNADKFINKAGKPFRAYGLQADKHDKFAVLDYSITPVDSETAIAVDDYIGVDGTTFKLKDLGATAPANAASRGFIGKVAYIEAFGMPIITGTAGTIDATSTKVVIEVIKNETV